MLTMHIPTREFFLLLMTKTWLKVPVREMFTILALGFLAEILLLKLQHLHDDYNYSEEDYDEHYDDNDIVFEGSDDDYGKNIDVGVTARPTQFAYPATTRKPTTKRPTHIYTDEDTPGVHREKPSGRPASFFAQPGILAAVIGGAVVGLLCAILLVMFIVYRMRKKDEGSYALDEPKRSHNVNSYSKPPSREFYA